MNLVRAVWIVIGILTVHAGFASEPEHADKTLAQWQEELQDQDANKQIAAAEALGKLGAAAEPAVKRLIELLADEIWQVRYSSARALGNIGPGAKTAVPALIGLLTGSQADEELWVRRCVIVALGQIGAEARQAVPHLVQCLSASDGTEYHAAEALGGMGITAIPTIPELMANKSSHLRYSAAKGLSRLGPKDRAVAVSTCVDILRDNEITFWTHFEAVCLLGQMGADAKAAIPALTRLLKEKKLIGPTAESLGRIGPDGAAAAKPILMQLLQDPNEDIRSRAGKALEKLTAAVEQQNGLFLQNQ